jgi:hypothetical protein
VATPRPLIDNEDHDVVTADEVPGVSGALDSLLPEMTAAGRPEKHPRRALVDAILYVLRTGCVQHQHPPHRPRRAGDLPAQAHLHTHQLIFANAHLGLTTA